MNSLTAPENVQKQFPVGSCKSRCFCSTSQQTTQFSTVCLSLQQTLQRKCKDNFHELGFENPDCPKGHFLPSPHHFIVSSCPGALFCIIISIKVAQYNFNVFSNQGNISSDMNNIFSLLLNTCPQGCPAVMSLWIITSNLKFLFYTFGLVLLERNLCIPPPKMLLPLIYPPLLLPTHSFPSFCNSFSLHQGQLAGRGRRRETLGHPTSMNCVDLLILMLWT